MSERVRIGAICRDGTYSTATGRGAGSWHGGVSQWVYADSKPSTSYSGSSYSGSSYSGSSYSGSSYSGSSYYGSSSSRSSSQSWGFSGFFGFLKKCFKFILDVLYWIIFVPIFLVVGLCWLIFLLFKFLYNKLKSTRGVQAWIKEFRRQDPNIWEGVIVYYYIVYHLVGIPAYLLGLLLMISLKICKAGLLKLYKIAQSKFERDDQQSNEQDLLNLYYSGQQDRQNSSQETQLKQLKQKLASLVEQIATTKQANLSQTNTVQKDLQQQSTKITQLTQQLHQTTIQPSQTNQKTAPMYEQKLRQYHERLSKVSGQITKLKMQHQVEIEKVTREKTVLIEGLEEKIKELGQVGLSVMNRTLDSEEIVEEEGSEEDWESESDEEKKQQEKMTKHQESVNYEIPNQDKLSGFCYGTLKLIFFLLSVNVARIFCKVIQTQLI